MSAVQNETNGIQIVCSVGTGGVLGPGGHSNTSVVHMNDQRNVKKGRGFFRLDSDTQGKHENFKFLCF